MWFFAANYESDLKLNGKTVIITGGNSGIGLETTKDLYKRGGRIIMLCRDEQKARTEIKKLKEECPPLNQKHDIIFKYLDLGDISLIKKCATELLATELNINYLINNAGVILPPFAKTKDGLEAHMGINYFGAYLLTLLLLPRIISSAPARIINVSSLIHKVPVLGGKIYLDNLNFTKTNYINYFLPYSQSKMALNLFTAELARRLKAANINNVTVNSLHPGIIATDLARDVDQTSKFFNFAWNILKHICLSSKQGSMTTLYCVLEEKLWEKSGLYFSNCAEVDAHPLVQNEEIAKDLWNQSWKYVQLPENYNPLKSN